MTFLWGHLGLMWLPRHSGITRHCPAGAISANISCWHRDFPLWGLGLGISWTWIANQRALPSMANSRTQAVVVWNICISCMLHMAMPNRSYRKWTQWEEWQVAAVEQGSSARSVTGVQFQVEQPWPHVPWNPRHTGHTVARVAHRAGAHGAERAKIPKGGRTGAEGEGAMPRCQMVTQHTKQFHTIP